MKKVYLEPAVEVAQIEVELGIATSQIQYSGFGISDADVEDVDW